VSGDNLGSYSEAGELTWDLQTDVRGNQLLVHLGCETAILGADCRKVGA
jgi:hypothetical protein